MKAADLHVRKKGNLRAFDQGDRVDPNELLEMPCDVLAPCAIDRVITEKNADKIKCRILAEGANGPTSPEADLHLNKRWDEVFVIPDILCNAGGVIVSYFEWVQGLQAFLWSETEVTDKLFRILEHSFVQVIRRAKRDNRHIAPRRWRSASSESCTPNTFAGYFPDRLVATRQDRRAPVGETPPRIGTLPWENAVP